MAELGYSFRDQPWKTLDLFTSDSGDSGLLDLFTVGVSNELVSGEANLQQAPQEVIEADCPEVLLSVVRTGLKDPTQTVKETAILALGPLMNGPFETEALEILAPIAASENWRDRWRSATTLSLSNNPEAQKLLATLRQDPNHYVVAATLEANLRGDKQ